MKTKSSLILWAVAALFMSFWAVKFAMTGVTFGNSELLTFSISFCASLVSAVCGAGFMQQWLKK
jgi:competence transcription factor ComK